MDGAVEVVGADGCGVKVAVPSEIATREVGTAEFVDEAGFVEKGAGLAGAQACRNVVRHNMTRPDRSRLMKVPWNWLETLPERRQSAAPSRGNRYNIDRTFSFLCYQISGSQEPVGSPRYQPVECIRNAWSSHEGAKWKLIL